MTELILWSFNASEAFRRIVANAQAILLVWFLFDFHKQATTIAITATTIMKIFEIKNLKKKKMHQQRPKNIDGGWWLVVGGGHWQWQWQWIWI